MINWNSLNLPAEALDLLTNCPKLVLPASLEELRDLACGGPESQHFEVAYKVPGRDWIVEANVSRLRNGISANYPEPYMRRRDPDSVLIGDDLPTDKTTFRDKYQIEFSTVRKETFDWLKNQDLAAFAFTAGRAGLGLDAIAIVPANAAFFALGLAMLQGMLPLTQVPQGFTPKAVIYTAPVFRHTHFDGKQVVVHNRLPHLHELFSFNLYPGPSAKKGVYGMLIELGDRENWVTAHCSAVQVHTAYDNIVTIMHEGASGGGKSEMLEQVQRQRDGRLLLGENLVTGEKRHLEIPRTLELHPIADDMALCHPSVQQPAGGKLRLVDAENAWFLRVNHINSYGTDPHLESITAQPKEPLLFLNIDAVPGSRAMIWEHIPDAPGKPCPNPRVIIPRHSFPDILDGPINVDIRSFGVRTPPCTAQKPTYGIIGLFHILPPALAWLWRLVSPRGHDNPSIVGGDTMGSEGVGSYWPFATGRKVPQANLLLEQFASYPRTRHVLIPNQHIGAWRVGFMPQWIAREYLGRRGSAKFKPEQIQPSRCPLLGFSIHQLHVEGRMVARWFLQVDTQPEVGPEAYDQGAEILYNFFRRHLAEFIHEDLSPLGHEIIECCLDGGTLEDYKAIIPMDS